jgi:hypothetical protein
VGDTGCTASGYVESGTVHIYVSIPQDKSGLLEMTVESAYAPRIPVGGIFASLSVVSDIGKVYGYLNASGNLKIYVSSALGYAEAISFVYPLKSS